MEKLEVGTIVEQFAGHAEGVHFDLDDSGASLKVFFNRPTADEVQQFEQGNRFEMRLTTLRNIMVFTFKIGNLEWMDAPYHPCLSTNLTKLEAVPDESGYGMTILLIDAATGEVKHLRYISLSTKMSRIIKKYVDYLVKEPFDKHKYFSDINNLFAAYSTKKIASMSEVYYKLSWR